MTRPGNEHTVWDMQVTDYADLIVNAAKAYVQQEGGVQASLARNRHMHRAAAEKFDSDVAHAVVTDFVNFLAYRQGLDLGFYADDLS